jgi:hypothetical protein
MVDSTIPFSSNPRTLKRQPTHSFKAISAIGAARQSNSIDKLGSAKAQAIMDKLAEIPMMLVDDALILAMRAKDKFGRNLLIPPAEQPKNK